MEGPLLFESFKLKQIILCKLEGEQLRIRIIFSGLLVKKTKIQIKCMTTI